jgi:DNA repair exonuclease SbcCD ATPase subunit
MLCAMEDDKLDAVDAVSVTAIDDYWVNAPDSFSASVFARLQKEGPGDAILPLRLTPTARIGIAKTVIAASDEKINDLKGEILALRRDRDQSLGHKVVTFINAPLLEAAQKHGNNRVANDASENGKSAKEENVFFLKYLTLRNILGVLAVTATLIGSVFAFSVDAVEKKAQAAIDLAKLNSEKGEAESQLRQLRTQMAQIDPQCPSNLATRTAELSSATKQLQDTKQQLQQVNTNATAANKNLSVAQTAAARAAEQIATLQKDNAVLQQQLADLRAAKK